MGWILRILLFMLLVAVVLRSAYRFLHGVIEGAGMGSPRVNSFPVRPVRFRRIGRRPVKIHLERAGGWNPAGRVAKGRRNLGTVFGAASCRGRFFPGPAPNKDGPEIRL